MEELVIKTLENLISSAKDYEYFVRQSFDQLKSIEKQKLVELEKKSPRVKELLTEFETIYKRINEEI